MADNLTLSIGVDTAKMRADLAVMKQQYTDTIKQMNQAAREATRTGDRTGLDQAAKAADNLKREIIPLTRALKEQDVALLGVGRAAVGAARGMHVAAVAGKEMEVSHSRATREAIALSREVSRLDINVFSLAKTFREIPPIAVGIAAAGAAALAVGKTVDAAAASVQKVEDLHQATGVAREDIVALEKVFRDVNGDAAHVDSWLRRWSEGFTKAHMSAEGMADALSGVSVLRPGQPGGLGGVLRGGQAVEPGGFAPGGTMVLRGGQPVKLETAQGLGGLIDRSQYRLDEEGSKKAREDALKILSEINKNSHMTALEIARTEMPGVQPEVALRELLAQIQPGAMAAARAATAGEAVLTPGGALTSEKFQIATKNLAAAAENVQTATGLGMMTGATEAVEKTTAVVDNLTKSYDGLRADVELGIPAPNAAAFEGAWTDAINGIKNAWSGLVDSISSTSLPTPRGEATIPPVTPAGGMATGGVVPGRGSGDTVSAWLTPGEYVNRRSSVDYYGTDVFRALNSRALPRDMFSRFGFALGGLVGDGMRFAEGGLVGSTAGGTPVHLHLDGKQFAMTATESVAEALVGAARRQQMTSAGIKPSWMT